MLSESCQHHPICPILLALRASQDRALGLVWGDPPDPPNAVDLRGSDVARRSEPRRPPTAK
jgi:hypothetical protein